MDKLKLTAKQKVIFQAALKAAHDGGGTEDSQKILARVTKQYCEDEDAPDMPEKVTDSLHPSHVTRLSDASSFDEICINCGATDRATGGWGKLAEPCPNYQK